MLTVFMIRSLLSSIAFNFFGYLCPAFSSIKGIISKDIDSIQEYLTYWSVLGIILYIETIIKYFSAEVASKYPPEFKVIVILWLTLPQFQGAFRIYMLILKPYFEFNEKNIDSAISTYFLKIQSKFGSTLQHLLYQLLLQSNESLWASLAPSEPSTKSNLAKAVLTASMMNASNVGDTISAVIGQMSQSATKEGDTYRVPRRRSSSGSFHKSSGKPHNLLAEFSHLLQNGIHVYIPQYVSSNSVLHKPMTTARSENNMDADSKLSIDFDSFTTDTAYCPSTYKGCKLTLNRHKNCLIVQFNEVLKENTLKKFSVNIWDIQQLDMDYMEHSETEEDTKVLKLITYSPIKCVEHDVVDGLEGGAVLTEEPCLTEIVITTQAPSIENSALDNSDEEELLDSILYGLPILIQQFKKTISQRYRKIEKYIIAPKLKMLEICQRQQELLVEQFVTDWEEKEWNRLRMNAKKRNSMVVTEQTLCDAEELLLTAEERSSFFQETTATSQKLNVEVQGSKVGCVDRPRIHVNLVILKKHFLRWQNNV